MTDNDTKDPVVGPFMSSEKIVHAQVLQEITPYIPTLDLESSRLIVLRRYEETETRSAQFGVHIIADLEGDDQEGYEHHTLNLMNEDQLQALLNHLVTFYGHPAESTWTTCDPDLSLFIHARIIPLEWKEWTPAQYNDAISILDFPGTTFVPITGEALPEQRLNHMDADEVNNLFGFVTDQGTQLWTDTTWSCVTPVEGVRLSVRARIENPDVDVNVLERGEGFLRGVVSAYSALSNTMYGADDMGFVSIPYAYACDLLDASGRVAAGGYQYADLVRMARMMTTSIHASVAEFASTYLYEVLGEGHTA